MSPRRTGRSPAKSTRWRSTREGMADGRPRVMSWRCRLIVVGAVKSARRSSDRSISPKAAFSHLARRRSSSEVDARLAAREGGAICSRANAELEQRLRVLEQIHHRRVAPKQTRLIGQIGRSGNPRKRDQPGKANRGADQPPKQRAICSKWRRGPHDITQRQWRKKPR